MSSGSNNQSFINIESTWPLQSELNVNEQGFDSKNTNFKDLSKNNNRETIL